MPRFCPPPMTAGFERRRENLRVSVPKASHTCYSGPVDEFTWGAARVGRHHIQVFIPSVDRTGVTIQKGQEHWVQECLKVLGMQFGGATAFPPAQGVWRDDSVGELVWDETVVVFSYVPDDEIDEQAAAEVRRFLLRLGRETNQGEVGLLIDGDYIGIRTYEEGEAGET